MNTTRIISIDWDYFAQENPMADFGHAETPFFINDMWAIRAKAAKASGTSLEQMVPLAGDPLGLAAQLVQDHIAITFDLFIAESHASILSVLDKRTKGPLEIMNLDAHHDICYGQKRGKPGCDTWVSYTLEKRQVKRFVQVYPEWRNNTRYKVDKLNDEAMKAIAKTPYYRRRYGLPDPRSINGNKTLLSDRATLVFVCRSGAWVPPAYDKLFVEFVRAIAFKSEINVMDPREIKEDW